jgi:hypothetical protein
LLSRNDFDTLPINCEKVTTRGTLDQHDRHFNPDSLDRPIVAGMVDTQEKEDELPVHTHRKGQLVLVQRGGVIYEVPSGLWMVPAALWRLDPWRHAAQQSGPCQCRPALSLCGYGSSKRAAGMLHPVDYAAAA